MTLFRLLDAVLAVGGFLAHDTIKSFQCLSSILAELVLFPRCLNSFHIHIRGQSKCQDSSFRTTDFASIEHITSLLVTLQEVAKVVKVCQMKSIGVAKHWAILSHSMTKSHNETNDY